MKVLFLTLYPEIAASPRYRVHQFLPYLQARGIECTVCAPVPEAWYPALTGPRRKLPAGAYHLVETPRRLLQIMRATAFDVVIVQKALLTAYVRGFASILRTLARTLVLDIDDAVHLAQPQPVRAPWRWATNAEQVSELMRSADLVLTGNSWLAEEVQRVGGRAEPFPTVVDTKRFTPAETDSDSYRIGWMGGPSTTPALEVVKPVLQSFEDEIELVGASKDQCDIPNAHYSEWNLETEVASLRRFSLGIMPLAGSKWDRGKCGLKALQYMACGIPCVSTRFGAATDIIRDGVDGILANDSSEWRDAFERLRDADARLAMGTSARARVEEHYSLDVAAPKLAQVLESLT